jgi:hypothetical protein
MLISGSKTAISSVFTTLTCFRGPVFSNNHNNNNHPRFTNMEDTSLAGPPLRRQQSDIGNAMARPSPEYIDFTGDDDGAKGESEVDLVEYGGA